MTELRKTPERYDVPLYGGADFDALREAARDFYNATVGQPGMRLTTADEAMRDAAKAAGERLRAMLVASGPNAAGKAPAR